MSKEGLGELVAEGRIIPASAVDLAQVQLGVAVRAGAPNRTSAPWKQCGTCCFAQNRSMLWAPPGSISPTNCFRISVSREVTSKIKGGTAATVATGEVEIPIRPVSELANVPGIDFVGPVPEEVQYLSIFSAAIVAGSHRVDAGQQLIHFLGSQAADAAIRRSGMAPVKSR
jgi:molybdate transport system substrate-binding protein